MQVTMWHNPRCSKSRETLQLLRDRGIEPEIRLYLEDTPSEDELRGVLGGLGITAAELVRRKEPEFRDLELDTGDTNESALIAAMANYPRLIERPLVISGKGVALGRPPEQVLSIL